MQKYLHLSLSAGSFACEMLANAPVVKQIQQQEEEAKEAKWPPFCVVKMHTSHQPLTGHESCVGH
jgi:hypothetical protein